MLTKKFFEKTMCVHDPDFTIDPKLSDRALRAGIYAKYINRIRAQRLRLYGMNPDGLMLGKGVQFFNPRDIVFTKNNLIGDYSYIHALGPDSLTFGENSGVGSMCKIVTSVQFNDVSGYIRFGKNVWIGDGSHLGGAGGLDIGDDTFTGQYITIHPENHRFDIPDQLYRLQGVTRKGIKIGRNCWIGAKVTITDGVTIGDHCVIAAGSVITKDIPDCSLAGGVPAKVIRTLPESNVYE